jgi:hypothetical protein
MLVITPQELIETLKNYKQDELLMVTWWSQEDVELLIENEEDIDKAKDIWNDIVWDLDKRTSDQAISSVNEELDTMVYDELGKN